MIRFTKILVLNLLIFIAFIFSSYANVKGKADLYKVTMRKVELCTASTGVTSCENGVVIGSGDVLSGLIASLIGKNKINPFLAACAGVWIHGDLAKQFGHGLIAEDIIKKIPKNKI